MIKAKWTYDGISEVALGLTAISRHIKPMALMDHGGIDDPYWLSDSIGEFYTVDDFNPHITKFNKMVIVWHLASS
jgi:hypothetical protein